MGADYSFVFVVRRDQLVRFHEVVSRAQTPDSDWLEHAPWLPTWDFFLEGRRLAGWDVGGNVDSNYMSFNVRPPPRKSVLGAFGRLFSPWLGSRKVGVSNEYSAGYDGILYSRLEGDQFALCSFTACTSAKSRDFCQPWMRTYMTELGRDGGALAVCFDAEDGRLTCLNSERSFVVYSEYVPNWATETSLECAIEHKADDERAIAFDRNATDVQSEYSFQSEYSYSSAARIDELATTLGTLYGAPLPH
jgi:hypothetical protein